MLLTCVESTYNIVKHVIFAFLIVLNTSNNSFAKPPYAQIFFSLQLI